MRNCFVGERAPDSHGANPWYTEDYPGNRGSEFVANMDNRLENIGRVEGSVRVIECGHNNA
jgi:hypothetical protein